MSLIYDVGNQGPDGLMIEIFKDTMGACGRGLEEKFKQSRVPVTWMQVSGLCPDLSWVAIGLPSQLIWS